MLNRANQFYGNCERCHFTKIIICVKTRNSHFMIWSARYKYCTLLFALELWKLSSWNRSGAGFVILFIRPAWNFVTPPPAFFSFDFQEHLHTFFWKMVAYVGFSKFQCFLVYVLHSDNWCKIKGSEIQTIQLLIYLNWLNQNNINVLIVYQHSIIWHGDTRWHQPAIQTHYTKAIIFIYYMQTKYRVIYS